MLMTHLCHKPVGGGDRDCAVQQPICRTLGVVSFELSTEGFEVPQCSSLLPIEVCYPFRWRATDGCGLHAITARNIVLFVPST